MFKVGDWIVNKQSNWVARITNISENICDLSSNKHETFKTSWIKKNFELWKPQQGEWCWFCSVNGYSELGQFVEEFAPNRYRYKLNGTNSMFNCDSSRCEPFIGSLPSFIKKELYFSYRNTILLALAGTVIAIVVSTIINVLCVQ